jgi:hypothetical protein
MEKLATGVFKNKRFLSIALKKTKGSNSPCDVQLVTE